jgi:hypothetical protein
MIVELEPDIEEDLHVPLDKLLKLAKISNNDVMEACT